MAILVGDRLILIIFLLYINNTSIGEVTGKFARTSDRKVTSQPFELCVSLNPQTVVAEGLAIKAAILTGVETGKLKDLLMMDCISYSIGLLSWNEGDSKNRIEWIDNDLDLRERTFDPIICRGDSIPTVKKKIFKLGEVVFVLIQNFI